MLKMLRVVKISRAISRPAGLAALTVPLILGLGCASRRGSTDSRPMPDVTMTERQAGEPDSARAGKPDRIRLPGQDRLLPSEDPRNRPQPGVVPPMTVEQEGPGKPIDPAAQFLPPPIPPGESRFRVQVLASTMSLPSFRMREELAAQIPEPVFVEQERGIWKVRVGDLKDREQAEALRRRMLGLGYDDAFVVALRGR